MADNLETQSENGKTEKPTPDESTSEIGQFCAFDWTPEPHYLSNDTVWTPEQYEDDGTRDISPLSEDAKKALLEIDSTFAKEDIAPRRIEVMQSWRANHYFRGYQFLLCDQRKGWVLPSSGSPFSPSNQQFLANNYHTNVYAEKGEIIIAALTRAVPGVEFFPANPEHGPDQMMVEVSDDLKDIWAKNNDLLKLIQNAAQIFWNDDRCLFWTYYELNGEEYGYEDPEEPVVPENEANPPTEPTDTEGSTQYQESNDSPADATQQRKPRGRVRTKALGKLSHKCSINVDDISEMGVISIFQDPHVSVARAQFPWMKDKIKGGGDGSGETEFDRVARENVMQALAGQYVTGDAIAHHCVIKHTYIRRNRFFSDKINRITREELLQKFPDGALLVKAGQEFAFARNEGIDDHCSIGHPFPGKGQNRKALGESLLPIQDYINELISLVLDFAKRTVAKKWFDSEAFNLEAMKKQTNIPGSSGGFTRIPGVAVDQLVFIEPTPTPQPWLVTFVQWVITSLTEQISGALPSLFGAQISGQVGSEGVALQRDQAMQRQGCPWNSLKAMFACAAGQAARLQAKCASRDIDDVVPGKGRIQIKLNNLKGKVLSYPEADSEFPESSEQRRQRITEIVDQAIGAPTTDWAKMVLDPKNLKAIQSATRLKDFQIKGANSVAKQEAEFEILLRSGPVPSPQKLMLQKTLAEAKMGLAQLVEKSNTTGISPTPEEQQQAAQAPQMIQMLKQQIQQTPDQSSIPVRGDGSEDDAVEKSVCFDWLNGPDGRKFEYGNPQQKSAFQNVLLHWKEHDASDKKLSQAAMPPPPPPKVSFSATVDKLPAPEAAAVVTAGGIPANAVDFEQHAQVTTNREMQAKIVPDQLYTSALHDKSNTNGQPK